MFSHSNYVLEVAKTGSFSRAAENLYITQPSLSAFIQRLESQIGEPLFDRSVHPVRLTECGMEYLRTAHLIDEAQTNFHTYLEENRLHQSGQLTIGAGNSKMSYILPPLLTKYRSLYPQIKVSLVENKLKTLQELIMNGSIDLILSSAVLDAARFEEYPYQSEVLLLAVPDHFPCNEAMKEYQLSYEDILADVHLDPSKPIPPLTLLGDTPFLTTVNDYLSERHELKLFHRDGFHPNSLFSIRYHSTALHLASCGMGCAIIADSLIKLTAYPPRLIYYKLAEPENTRLIRFHKKKGRRLTFAMRSFLECAGITDF